jgi:hypothetical protein
MLARTTHMIYIVTVAALLAALLIQPALRRSGQQADNDLAAGELATADADGTDLDDPDLTELAMLEADRPLAAAPGAGPGPSEGPELRRPMPHAEGQPPRPGDRGAARAARMSPELIERCLDVAREIDREMGDRLARQRDRDPAKFARTMRVEVGRRLIAMAQLKERNPELYQLKLSEITMNVQVHKLAGQLREAMKSGDAKRIEPLKNQLRTQLQIQQALSLKSRGDTICAYEEQLERLREDLSHEADNFALMVDARMQHLLENDHRTPGPAPAGAGNGKPE